MKLGQYMLLYLFPTDQSIIVNEGTFLFDIFQRFKKTAAAPFEDMINDFTGELDEIKIFENKFDSNQVKA